MSTNNFTNHFLIAMPGMGDPRFAQTVTFVYRHNDEGAIGIVINRPSEFTIGNVLKQMDIKCDVNRITKQPVLHGGPLQTERGFILHSGVAGWDASYQVDERWAVTTSRDILEAIAKDSGPEHAIMALGYAGWEAGQLEQEISENAWLTAPADDAIVFKTPIEQRWSAAAGLMGIDVSQLAGYAGHA